MRFPSGTERGVVAAPYWRHYMNRDEILGRLTHHCHVVARRELAITEQTQLDYRGLGLTSIQVLSVLVKLEDELGLELDDVLANIDQLKTVADLLDHFASAQSA
jgi:acyl carrier protein